MDLISNHISDKIMRMKRAIAFLCILLCALLLSGCGGNSAAARGYRVVSTYDTEGSYVIAFREGDELCAIVTAVLRELSANGTLRTASQSWFGSDLSCVKGEAGAMDELWSHVEPRNLVVGIDVNNMPMSYTDGVNYYGFDVDLASYICGYLGWSMTFQPISASDVGVQLQSGNVDCAIGVPLGGKEDGFDYSPAYLSSKYVLITRSDSGISTKSGLKGKILGAVVADVDVLQQDAKFVDKLDHVTYQTGTEGLFDALDAGDVDGILVSSAVAAYYMR